VSGRKPPASAREALLTDVLAWLHKRRVRARDYGLAVNGQPDLVSQLRAGLPVSMDFEIRLRVVMVDWEAYGRRDPVDAADHNLNWRRKHGYASKAEGIRLLARQGLNRLAIAQRLELPAGQVSSVLLRRAPEPKRRAA
jgi:hypothetical protein